MRRQQISSVVRHLEMKFSFLCFYRQCLLLQRDSNMKWDFGTKDMLKILADMNKNKSTINIVDENSIYF